MDLQEIFPDARIVNVSEDARLAEITAGMRFGQEFWKPIVLLTLMLLFLELYLARGIRRKSSSN